MTAGPVDGRRRTKKVTAVDTTHLTWPFFDPAHRELAARFSEWSSLRLSSFQDDEGGDGVAARAIFQAMADEGWLERTLPQHRDGAWRIDLRGVCLLREISAHCAAIVDVALSEPWLGILPVALFGSEEAKSAYLPRYAAGALLPAFALSEPEAGSDAASIATTARRDGDGYVINGCKTWTSNAGLADIYVVFARLEDTGGMSAFLVDGRQSGISLSERISVLPPHTVGTWRLHECRVPADHLLGAPGEGFRIAMTALELFRPSVGAAALGFARRAMAEALERSIQRKTFKKPISEHQLVQAKLADMAVKVDAAALLVYRAAWSHDRGERTSREAAIAKLFASETACDVIDEAVQIHGGMGVTKGTTVERLFRHARAFRIFDGTSEIQRLVIARDMLRDAKASSSAEA